MVDEIARNVCLREGGNVVQRLGGIIWHQAVHDDFVGRDAQRIGDPLGKVGKDLICRVLGSNHKGVVEPVIEANLD